MNTDIVWNIFGKNCTTVIDYRNTVINLDLEKCEYHIFGEKKQICKNIIYCPVMRDLDEYCEKMDIHRISLLRLDNDYKKNKILKYTDMVEFSDNNFSALLQEEGFLYFYKMEDTNIALRVEKEEAIKPIPNIGIICIN